METEIVNSTWGWVHTKTRCYKDWQKGEHIFSSGPIDSLVQHIFSGRTNRCSLTCISLSILLLSVTLEQAWELKFYYKAPSRNAPDLDLVKSGDRSRSEYSSWLVAFLTVVLNLDFEFSWFWTWASGSY